MAHLYLNALESAKSKGKDKAMSNLPNHVGCEYFNHHSHGNIEILLEGGEKLKVNSIVLAMNSPVLKAMIEEKHQTTIEMDDFGSNACRIFIRGFYVGLKGFYGGVNTITRKTFRDLSKMAYTFKVYWVQEECLEFFLELTQSIKTVEDEMYLLEEAIAAKIYDKDARYLETLVEKRTSLFAQSSQHFEEMLENLENLSLDHLDFLIRVANKSHIYGHSEKYQGYKEYRQFIVEKVTEHIKKLEEMDEKTRYTLKHLTLTETSDGTVKPRFTANPDIPRPFPFPQIGLNIHNVNQTKLRFTADPDLPRMFSSLKHRGKSGFYCNRSQTPGQVGTYYSNSLEGFNEEFAPLESSTSMTIIRPGRDHYQSNDFKDAVRKMFTGLMELSDISAEDLKLVLKISLTFDI